MLSIFAASKSVVACLDETMFLINNPIQEFKNGFDHLEGQFKLVVEKTPRHVYALDQILPDQDCDALVMIRNPVDVVASLKKRGLPVKAAIKRYQQDNLQWMDRIDQGLFYPLKYEDLVNDTDSVLKALGDRYGIDLIGANNDRLGSDQIFFSSAGATNAKLTAGRGTKQHLALRNYQMRQPVQNMNGAWKQRLNKAELSLILKELESFITQLGYEECLEYEC